MDIVDDDEEAKVEVSEEPSADEKECCVIQLRFANNKAVKRRFRRADTLGDVARFVRSVDATLTNVVFVCPPNASYDEMGLSLDEICTELKSQMLVFRVKQNQKADVKAQTAKADAEQKKAPVFDADVERRKLVGFNNKMP